VGASHPAAYNRSIDLASDRVRTAAMRVRSDASFNGIPGNVFATGSVENMGDEPLTNVRIILPASISLPDNFLANSGRPKVELAIPATIPPHGHVTFNVSAQVIGPFFSYT
jgi:hypothetical protein